MSERKKVKVGELGRIVTGKTPKTSINSNYGGDIPFLTPSDDMSVKFVLATNKTITKQGLSEVKNCLLPVHSICVSCIGSDLGKVVITTKETVSNQQINSIILNEELYDKNFIYYAMLILGKELNHISKTSTAVPIVNKTSFSNYEITVPKLEIQKQIAKILSSIDDKIELNNKINDNLEQQAQAIFKSWFVDFEPFGGVMPSDWKKTTLGEVTKPIRDRVKDKPCTVLSAINTGILQPSEDYFTKQVFSKDISKYIVVEKYDFAYNPSRVNIGSIGINDYEFIGCVSPVYVVFRTEKHYHNFMNFHIKTSNFKEEVKTRASGSVRQAMNYTDFSLIEVVYPNLNTVIKFNEIYDAIKNTIKHNVFENQKLAKLRDTLLPRLMSGEIDVSQVES